MVFLEYLNFDLSVQAKKKKKCGEIRKKTKESLRTPYFNIAVPVYGQRALQAFERIGTSTYFRPTCT